jgi:cysteine-rich repeat protein
VHVVLTVLVALVLTALPASGVIARAFASPCGNGIVEPDEACDDGNAADGDCCSSTCEIDPFGTACADEGNLCSNDTCDETGTCTHTVAPAPGCLLPFTPGRTTFSVRIGSAPKLGWQWKGGPATLTSDFGDPTLATDYALCVYDHSAGIPSLALREDVPAATTCLRGPCWRISTRGFSYNDPVAVHGLAKIKLRAGPTGTASIKISGKNAALGPVALPMGQDPTVVVQLRNALGKCWGTSHATNKRNDATELRAR